MSEVTQKTAGSEPFSWGRVKPETRRRLEDFARGAARHLESVGRQPVTRERWERDPDGVFRRSDRRQGWRWNMFTELETVPGYEGLCAALREDPCIGPQVDKLIGTQMGSFRVEPRNVIGRIVTESWGQTSTPVFDEQRFASAFDGWRDLFEATRLEVRTVAVLLGASIDVDDPLDIDGDDLVIDRLNDVEIASALSTGLAGLVPADSTIFQGELVGARRISWLDKTVSGGGAETPPLATEGDGVFGCRPMNRLDLFADDVATLLRLHGTDSVVVSGSYLLGTRQGGFSLSWNVRQRPSNGHGNLHLATNDVSPLQCLWSDLCLNAKGRRHPPPIAFSRFTSAFDKSTLQDKLVDVMIAAEALFLQEDGSPEDRGELSFRLALRAAHFIFDPTRDKVAIFDEVKKAYALRSRLVHGGIHATTSSDVDPVTDLVRRALVQALATIRTEEPFGTSQFWKALQLR